MRVLYFYQYFTVPEGSYSTRVYEFARRWVKAGDSITVVTSVYDKSGINLQKGISRFNIEGIDVRMINIRLSNKHGVAYRVFTFLAYAVVASWYALALPADVVVCSSPPFTIGLPGLLARYFRRRPLVFEVRDLWPEIAIQSGVLRGKLSIRLARFFEKRFYRAASRIVVLSEGMANWIKDSYGFQHVEVIPNASDNQLVELLDPSINLPAWARGKNLAMFVGALGLMNDCGQILEAAQIVQIRGIADLEFVIIGDGKERAGLEHKMRALKLNNVHFLDLMPKEEALRWLRSACCALLTLKDVPVLSTSSPNKLLDAFAVGVPVVQVTQGWIKDLLEREQCGITVPPNDPEAMADAVLKLARGDGFRTRLAANARRVAREQFDRTMLAEKMRRILLAAADGESAGTWYLNPILIRKQPDHTGDQQ